MSAPDVTTTVDPGPTGTDVTGTGGDPPATRRRRRGAVSGPALVAGMGLALSLPPWGFWILAFPGAGLLWWRLGGLRMRTRFWAGWVAGLGLFGPGLFWGASFNLAGGIAMILIEALALALASAAAMGRTRLMALPAAMVLTEGLRSSWPFGGVPLGGVALGQAAAPLAGAARLGGPLLVVGLVWLGGGALGALVVALVASGPGVALRRRLPDSAPVPDAAAASWWRAAVGPGALVVVVVAAGVVGAVAPDGGPAVRTVRVASVQGGGVRGYSKAQVDPTTVLDAQYAATAELPRVDGGRPPTLVVWPEDVVSLGQRIDGTPTEADLQALARRLHATLLVGVTETVSRTAFRNEIVAFGPDGALIGRFEKVHRVPFGEYVPFRSFFSHLANLSGVPLDAIPGTASGMLRTPAGSVGLMISYEVFFADRGRSATRAGAQLLVVPTNTSSYSTAQVPTQEIAADRLQAIAMGRDLVQAAPTGYSDVVDHRGRLIVRSALGARQTLVEDVALRDGTTWYVRFGDLPWIVLAALVVVGAWADELRRRRARPAPEVAQS